MTRVKVTHGYLQVDTWENLRVRVTRARVNRGKRVMAGAGRGPKLRGFLDGSPAGFSVPLELEAYITLLAHPTIYKAALEFWKELEWVLEMGWLVRELNVQWSDDCTSSAGHISTSTVCIAMISFALDRP